VDDVGRRGLEARTRWIDVVQAVCRCGTYCRDGKDVIGVVAKKKRFDTEPLSGCSQAGKPGAG
jgi:hypothetical protein